MVFGPDLILGRHVIASVIVSSTVTHLTDRWYNNKRQRAAHSDGYKAGILTAHQDHYDAGHIGGARYGHGLATAGRPLPAGYLPPQRHTSTGSDVPAA